MQMNEPPQGQDLLAELEASIPQGVANDTGFRRRAEDVLDLDNDLLELDQLLAESVGVKEAEAQYKKDREQARKGYAGMSKEEVDFCNSRMHAFEMAKVWDADRSIAVFRRYTCDTCRKVNTVFHQYLEHHKHRHNRTAHRWLAVMDTKFPPEPVVEEETVPFCPACALPEYNINLRGMRSMKEAME